MKTKVLLAGLVAAVLGVSGAVAAPPPGKGPPTTGAGCKPQVTVVLKGMLLATPGPPPTKLSVKVTSGNHFAQAYVTGPQPVSVAVDANTKVRRQGGTTLLMGDRVLVQARVCKAALASGAKPDLTAVRVVAHPAKS